MPTQCLACERGAPKRGRRRCPLCEHRFRGSGWDGIEAHWRARHLGAVPYERFWKGLCRAHRSPKPRECLSCRKNIPTEPEWPRQCPECALVFQGRGWEGLDSHWKRIHPDVMTYDDFLASLCPAHRRTGDRGSRYLPLR